MKKRKLKFKPASLLMSFVAIGIAGYFFYLASQEIGLTISLSNEVADSQAEINRLEAQNEQLVNQKLKLQDPEYVKSYARGAYLLSKDGEQIFHLSGGE